jgi:hypothetical protein
MESTSTTMVGVGQSNLAFGALTVEKVKELRVEF